MRFRRLLGLFLLFTLLAMFGCGGGDGVHQPTKATVKLATAGTLPADTLICGIQTTLNYSTDVGLAIAADDVVASGVGAGSVFTPNTSTIGQVGISLINTEGIPIGEFATATFGIAAGNFPTPTDFSVAPGSAVLDVCGNQIPDISVVISSLTIQ